MSPKNKLENHNSDIKVKIARVVRCAKAVKGGRRFAFAVLAVAGDGKGKCGIGFGKAGEVADARDKAEKDAIKNIAKISLRDNRTLHHDIEIKFCSGKLKMRAAPPGTGIIAGGSVRHLCEVLGVKDIVIKSLASNNAHNMVKAAVRGFRTIRSLRYIAEKRGKKIAEIIGVREQQLPQKA